MFSVVKTRSLNCPQILFHRLTGEALLFLLNTIFLMNAMNLRRLCTRKGFSPLKNGKIDGRDNTDLQGNFEKILKNHLAHLSVVFTDSRS